MTDTPRYVRELMTTELMTLQPDERLHLAADLMKLGRVRHMPVVTDGRLVGIVTQRDLFRAAVSSVLQFRASAEREWLEHISVAEVMTREVITAAPDWPVARAVDAMLEHRIGCLPVVENDRLVGLVTESTLMRLLARLLAPPGIIRGRVPAS